MSKTQAQLESSLRQFFRTRPNEELSRVANSTPSRFNSSLPVWSNGKGCLICHLTDNHSGIKDALYTTYKCNVEGATQAELDYFNIRDLFHPGESWSYAQYQAGAVCIRLANEVLAERGDMNILDDVEAICEFDREGLPTV